MIKVKVIETSSILFEEAIKKWLAEVGDIEIVSASQSETERITELSRSRNISLTIFYKEKH